MNDVASPVNLKGEINVHAFGGIIILRPSLNALMNLEVRTGKSILKLLRLIVSAELSILDGSVIFHALQAPNSFGPEISRIPTLEDWQNHFFENYAESIKSLADVMTSAVRGGKAAEESAKANPQ